MEIKNIPPPRRRISAVILIGLATQLPVAAVADETKENNESAPDFTVTGTATLTNDYIWRGLSQTFGKPALQAGVEVQHTSGAYLGFWGSNVSDRWVPGANLETDLYGGFRTPLPGVEDLSLDVGLIYVYYPGGDYKDALDGKTFKGSSPNTWEAYIGATYKSVSLKYGRTLTKFYGWNENNSAPGVFSATAPSAGVTGSTRGSQYVELGLNYEIAEGWTGNGQAGHQWIANSQGLDWSYYRIGVTKSLPANWSAAIAYSWTTEPKAFENYASLTGNGDTADVARPRVVVSVSRQF